MPLKPLFKRLALALFEEYQLNRVYCLDTMGKIKESDISLSSNVAIGNIEYPSLIKKSPDERIRDHAWYAGKHAIGYGIWESGQLVSMCWFWTPERHGFPQRFADLNQDEVVMVDLLTAPAYQGKGYASAIADYAARDLAQRGYRRLWTWVWHSNTPSIRVFDKAGWLYRYFLVELKLPTMKDYLRFKLPARTG